MYLSFNLARIREFLFLFCAFFIVGVSNANSSFPIENWDVDFTGNPILKNSFETELFVPGISLIKTGVTVDATGTPGNGCDSILFTF